MLQLLLVVLLQTVPGAPAQPENAPAAPAPMAAPATEPAATGQAAPDQTDAQAPAAHVECHMEQLVGSRMSTRVCTTARQRRQQQDGAEALMRRVQNTRDGQAH